MRLSSAAHGAPIANRRQFARLDFMFTIEHEFDSTVVTLIDEGKAPLTEDVTINAFEECVTVEQYDPRTDSIAKVTFSISQMNDLAAALDLPEGVYQLRRAEEGSGA